VTELVLRLENLSKRFSQDRAAIFENLSLQVRQGEYLAIMGESGVGKSTLLNLLAGLDSPSSGRVLLEGVDLSTLNDDATTLLRRRAIGFVFQAFHVLPYLTVLQNVALPLDLLGVAEPERSRRTADMLSAVGIEPLSARFARELSGGEVQRVAIARALVHRPRLLLADEPTGNLDTQMARGVLDLLEELHRDGATIVMVTHDPELAIRAQREVHIVDGQVVDLAAQPRLVAAAAANANT
jgi:putative ABC transport system ATP-binding protein